MKLPKGHVFHGPDGQGYRLTRDVQTGDPILADMFEAFGGAPVSESGKQMPNWLFRGIQTDVEAQKRRV